MHNNHKFRLHWLAAGLAAGLMTGSAQGAILSFAIDDNGAGGGSFSFDDSLISWVNALDHTQGGTVALADFLSFNWDFGTNNFSLADLNNPLIASGQGAWLYGDDILPDPDIFSGLDLTLTDVDTIVFAPGFGGPNDYGTVEANLGGAILLDDTNTHQIPEPETWLGSLLAATFGFAARKRRRMQNAVPPVSIFAEPA